MNKIVTYIQKFINLKFGLAGAFFMGVIVFFINLSYGWQASLIAGMKQWFYTFLFGGAIIRLLEILLNKTKTIKYSILISVLIISVITSTLIFIVHNFKGTPEPFYSTLPTIILSPPGFMFIANRFKKSMKNS